MVQKNCLNKLIIIVGPTGVGKSDYGVDVALNHNGEIINADSVQIYKGLDIGSGKIKKEEMKGVPHHLLSLIDPSEQFTVVDFSNKAKECIKDIQSRGKLPIVVGGTGFYVNALLHDYDCGDAGPDYELRDRLRKLEEENGEGYLAELLYSLKPDSTVEKKDTKRVIRQLELYYSDKKDSSPKNNDKLDALLIIMDADRKELDKRAEIRIRKMFSAGLVDEVKSLKDYFSCRITDSIGYKEVKLGLENNLSEEEIIDMMKLNYHRLIKKQQTFFRWIKWDNKLIINNWDFSQAEEKIKEFLNEY
ncbi:MAG: tRNA (adenosine(37)-N6)-dimethylallyltransferase MiaA [Clostridia bacterium]|nr:tRNA (adenosine(37)-N6)-dimethylallyltransferase MiaA [Clostridia bacterium]